MPVSHSLPILRRILLPIDYSDGAPAALHHALRSALISRASLHVLCLRSGEDSNPAEFPGVRATLERWGLLPEGSPRAAVRDLGINVRVVVAEVESPVASVLHYLERHPADLIVLATHRKEGRMAWLGHTMAEPVARESGQMTLLLPDDVPGFVSARDGSVSLRSILVPIAEKPAAQPAIEAAARFVSRLGLSGGTFTTLHVGGPESAPAVSCPEVAGWSWEHQVRDGAVIETILDTAQSAAADLVVMSTDGRHGFLDALRGSHSERILRQVRCPLLVVPEKARVVSDLL